MYYPRAARQGWFEASQQFPVLLLTGPRQVGKTTFLKHICDSGRRYVTLDDPALRTLANEDPGLFLERYKPPVLIDEIQYAPKLLPIIKMAVDSGRNSHKYSTIETRISGRSIFYLFRTRCSILWK